MTLQSSGRRRAALAVLSTAVAVSLPGPVYAAADGATAEATAAQTAAATASAPSGTITVEVVAANGTGCAPGTATVAGKPDQTGFRIRYRDFLAEAGGNSDPTDRRRNCQLGVLVSIPAGWTFAIAEAEYRGRAKLEDGATGLQRTNYYWQGSSDNTYVDHPFTGPVHDFWRTTDVAHTLVYRPCDTQLVLNINTELRVDAGTSTKKSSLSMRSTEGDVDTLFNFSWVQC